jgi:hypothetical protein
MLPPLPPKAIKKRRAAAPTPTRGYDVPAVPTTRVFGAPRDGRVIVTNDTHVEQDKADAA